MLIRSQNKEILVNFNNRSKNSLTSIGDGMNCTFEPLFKIGWNACLREIAETSDENER